MKFLDLLEEHSERWRRTTGAAKLYSLSELRKTVASFLSKHGFKNLEHFAQGSSAVILKDLTNPDLMLRLAPTYSADRRALIPQVLQPVFVQEFDRLKIEFLRNVDIPESLEDDEFFSLLKAFKKEVRASGHTIESNDPQYDVGLFQYNDPDQPEVSRQVFIATDASLIPPKEGLAPMCSSNYPTLQDQWRVQCAMVEIDDRLGKLLKGMPKPLPETIRMPAI